MPLKPGSSPNVISENIHELTHHGKKKRSHEQIVAIALNNADKYSKRKTGGIASFASGGEIGDIPFFARTEERNLIDSRAGGFLNSNIGGRTDRIPAAVAADSYVIPADVVSGLGQGNSLAGANILNQALKTGPYGTNVAHVSGHSDAPHPPRMPADTFNAEATGGAHHNHMPIIVAGGEHIVPPEVVERIGRNKLRQTKGANFVAKREEALKAGHRCLDDMVQRVRAYTVKAIKNLPDPKR